MHTRTLLTIGLDTFGAIDQTTIGAAGLTINGGGQGETLTINGSTSYDQGLSATSGINSGTGLTGSSIQYSCNAGTLVNGLLLSYRAQ